jgi:Mg-chelatase subunit ChlD
MKKFSILAVILFLFVFAVMVSKTKVVQPVKVKDSLPVELVFVMDKSGSMSGFEGDTIGGYNTVLKEQGKGSGTVVTTVLFNNEYKVLFDGVKPEEAVLNTRNYTVGGNTAMLDAIGKTINDVKNRESKNGERKVIFVITTDGLENSSKEYTYETVSRMIDEQQKKGWVFMFLGANIDAAKEAKRLKIPSNQAATYIQSEEGNGMMYESINENISNVKDGRSIDFSRLEEKSK